jgi:hypothetical protein
MQATGKTEEAQIATIRDVIEARAKKRVRVYIPSLGKDIEYCPMKLRDLVEFRKGYEDKTELSINFLLRTWGQAEPGVTRETLMDLDVPIMEEIIQLLGFSINQIPLETQKQSKQLQSQA